MGYCMLPFTHVLSAEVSKAQNLALTLDLPGKAVCSAGCGHHTILSCLTVTCVLVCTCCQLRALRATSDCMQLRFARCMQLLMR